MRRPPLVSLVLWTGLLCPVALLACGASVPIEAGSAGTDTDGTDSEDASSATEAPDGPTTTTGVPEPTGAPTATAGPTSTTGSSETETSGVSDTETGTDDTGEPEPACPEDDWPDDGSELISAVMVSSVLEWAFTGDGASFFSYLSDESPVEGKQTRGLRSESAAADGFGVTFASLSAEPFRGQRLRMRSWVARSGVRLDANIWLRIDGAQPSILDNGSDRPGYGTSPDWEREEIVVDVPLDAETLAFGSLLVGGGSILVSDAAFDIVTAEVPTTQPNLRRPSEALACLDDLGPDAEALVHVLRPDAWGALSEEVSAELARDETMDVDGVPSLHLGGELAGDVGGFLSWSHRLPGQRLRLTVPIRAEDFAGELRLVLTTPAGEAVVAHRSEPIIPGDAWATYSVVTQLPTEDGEGTRVTLELAGTGDVWVGYGVVERVNASVPLSEDVGE